MINCPVDGKKAKSIQDGPSLTFTGSTKPVSPIEGNMYYDIKTLCYHVYDGVEWLKLRPIK